MHRLAEDGNKRARTVLALTEDRERLIGAVLLGNNLVNILASALATSLFLALFGEAGVVYATLVMTAVVLIFAEVAPKTVAITNTDRVALAVAPILRVVTFVFGPITAAVQLVVRYALRPFGLDVGENQHVLSAHEELRGAINLHHHEGSVVKIDRDMLGGILDLHDLEVSDVMVHRKNIVMIDASQPNSEVISQALASPHTRIRSGATTRKTSSAFCTPRTCCAPLQAWNGRPTSIFCRLPSSRGSFRYDDAAGPVERLLTPQDAFCSRCR